MGLETATYISDLNSSNPASSDPKSQGDDHLRLIKAAIKASLPNISGAVLATQVEINRLVGIGSALAGVNDAAVLTNKTISGSSNTITNVSLTTGITGTLAAANGGTGLTSPGASGNVLTSNGTTWVSTTLPSFSFPSAGIVVSTGSAWSTSKTAPSGALVGTTDSQTLTNKTISVDNNTISGIAALSFVVSNSSGNVDGTTFKEIPLGDVVGTQESQTLTNKTISGAYLTDGVREEYFVDVVSGSCTISFANGSIQNIGITGNTTFTFPSPTAGQSFTLLFTNGSSGYTVTWPSSVKWPGGTNPTTDAKTYMLRFIASSTYWYGAVLGEGY